MDCLSYEQRWNTERSGTPICRNEALKTSILLWIDWIASKEWEVFLGISPNLFFKNRVAEFETYNFEESLDNICEVLNDETPENNFHF